MIRNLQRIRKRYGLTQEELACIIGTSDTSLHFWETFQRMPRKRAVIRLSDFFGVSANELLRPTT